MNDQNVHGVRQFRGPSVSWPRLHRYDCAADQHHHERQLSSTIPARTRNSWPSCMRDSPSAGNRGRRREHRHPRASTEGFSQYLRLYWEMEELPTDEAVLAWGDIGIPEHEHADLGRIQRVPAVDVLPGLLPGRRWPTNSCARPRTMSSPRNVLTGTLKTTIQQYRAEARFLRALSYWHGHRSVRGHPARDRERRRSAETAPRPEHAAAIYAYVVRELTEIQSQLPAPRRGHVRSRDGLPRTCCWRSST